MGLLKLTESERLEILNLHNNARIIKEQAPSVVSTTSTPTAAPDNKASITTLQNILKTKYQVNLGTSGPNKDGVDGNLGPKTLAALADVVNKVKSAAPAAGAAPTTPPVAGAAPTTPPVAGAAPTTPPVAGQPSTEKLLNVIPNVSYQAPAGTTQTGTVVPPVAGDDEFGAAEPPQSNRNNRRARQDLRRGNRRAMQDLRTSQQNQQQ
jgi:hypothetical protein